MDGRSPVAVSFDLQCGFWFWTFSEPLSPAPFSRFIRPKEVFESRKDFRSHPPVSNSFALRITAVERFHKTGGAFAHIFI